jgi:hypothetical protein
MNYKGVLSILRFASDIVSKLPTRDDTIVTTFMKVLAIADSAQQRLAGGGSKIPAAFAHFDLVEATNDPFVRLFFGTRLKERFKVNKWALEPNRELIIASKPTGERFLFQENSWVKSHVSADFYHSPGIDFVAVMEELWQMYPRGLYLSIAAQVDGFYGHELTYQAVPPIGSEVLTTKGKARFQEVLQACQADRASGIHRCYIASGPPGTGKSSFVGRLAEALGGRMLKIDASSIPRIGVQELSFLLDALRPRVLLIDDFDRAPAGSTSARLLFLLEHLKAAHSDATIIITVNDATVLDPAMLRSERIDEPIDFELPDADERRDLIGQLLPQCQEMNRLVEETEGFNHADITDLCRRIMREPIDRVLKMKKRLRAMAEAATNKADTPKGGNKALVSGDVLGSPATLTKALS